MTATRSTVNNGWQFGLESTPGTSVAANRKMAVAMMDPPQRELDPQKVKMQGHKHTAATRHNKDYQTGKISGTASYNEMVYLLCMLFGDPGDSTPSGGVNIRQRTFELPLSGPNSPITGTAQYGDSTRAEQFAYMLLSGFTLKGSREGFVTIECPFYAQATVDGSALTSSPTLIAPTPILGAHWSLYRDPTWATLSTTQLPLADSWELGYTGLYEPKWPGNRSLGKTYGAHKELTPTAQFKVTLEADAAGYTSLYDARQDVPEFFSVVMQGGAADNYQVLTVTGSPSGGTFTLSYAGSTTGTIAYNDTAANVQTALRALPSIGATGCSVAGSNGGPWTVTMTGARVNDATAITLGNNSLSGGTMPSVTIANTVKSNALQLLLACGNMGAVPLKDGNNVIMEDYTFDLMEDTVGGHAGQLYVATAIDTL